jgi:SAM-dependent methyltransferase
VSDERTAVAFASSWNRIGAVYTREQFLEWMAPLRPEDFQDNEVLELGFGNGSLLVHAAAMAPRRLSGVELGDTLAQTERNLATVSHGPVDLHRGDLTTANLGEHDIVYCIGVLHHLADPRAGFDSVLRHTRPGGRFHCWVYAHEGNAVIRGVVDPVRRVASRLPWWLTRYGIALPLVLPYFVWAKVISRAPALARRMPLGEYTLWIARERLAFFHHVAFDQLVTPRTVYFTRSEIEGWLRDPRIDPASVYLIFRNGNSWKFGGRRRHA